MVILIWTVSIISLITTIVGLILLGNKNKNGFLIFNVSLNCQMVIFYFTPDCYGGYKPNWFLIIQMVILIVFNTYNYLKWGKDESSEN